MYNFQMKSFYGLIVLPIVLLIPIMNYIATFLLVKSHYWADCVYVSRVTSFLYLFEISLKVTSATKLFFTIK